MRSTAIWIPLILLTIGKTLGQTGAEGMPALIEKNGRHALLVDGKPFLILGGQAHNSSAWPDMMPNVWLAIQKLHANTLEIPVYWEQLEPVPGQFDFSLVDELLRQSREHHIRLVLLWFASWKNGSSHYMPEWMKRQPDKYPNIKGANGQPVDSPSPNTDATLEMDKRAFAALMRHLKKTDTQHTVIMVQVENEPGSWGSVRDYSTVSQKLFDGPVPAVLLKPEVLQLPGQTTASAGSWQQVFGSNADEYFQAWSVARFIDQVAAAGKAEYALPMYVNAALRDPLSNPKATSYESGGATDNVIPIWKLVAPHIDLLAPDIYLSGTERVLKVLDLYGRKDNPLFVPEAGLNPDNAKYFYSVMARGGIGFSPFGIDDNGRHLTEAELTEQLEPFAAEYTMATPMMRELAKWSFEGKIVAAVEGDDHGDQNIDLGLWKAIISFGNANRNDIKPNARPIGKILFVKLDSNQFIVTGSRCHVSFRPAGSSADRAWQYLKVEEGYYKNGTFHLQRILNGDETDWGGPRFFDKPAVMRISLILR
jgi:Domain of unknown function (DUF5597)/Beta-galactosidase